MSDKIDEEAILKFAGFEWNQKYYEYYSPDNEPSGEPNIHSLDWQAKYLWPKLCRRGVGLTFETGILLNGANIYTAYTDITHHKFVHEESATAILLAVQELIKEGA